MGMKMDDYFELLCQTKNEDNAIEYIEFLDIYGANYTDYLINIPDLSCNKKVKSLVFSKIIDLAGSEDMQYIIDILIENKLRDKIMHKALNKIIKVCTDIQIMSFEEEFFDYGIKKHKDKFNKIKEKYKV